MGKNNAVFKDYNHLISNNSYIFFFFFGICLFGSPSLLAQRNDSLTIQLEDTLNLKDLKEYSPSTAALYSAILPGMGQAYNRRYWKMPIIYGLGATLGYFIYVNNGIFLDFRDSFFAKRDGFPENDPFPQISSQTAELNRDVFRRNRDLLMILSVLLYGLNIVDATVDAHLRSFDVSDELSLHLEPSWDSFMNQPTVGFKLILSFP